MWYIQSQQTLQITLVVKTKCVTFGINPCTPLGGSSQLVSGLLITMVIGSPLSRVILLPNGLFMAYKWRLLTTYNTWDDPPSRGSHDVPWISFTTHPLLQIPKPFTFCQRFQLPVVRCKIVRVMWGQPRSSVKQVDFCDVPSLKLTASLPLKIGRNPIGKDRLPAIDFQGRKCCFQGGYCVFFFGGD